MKKITTFALLLAGFCLTGCSNNTAERKPPSQADLKKMKEQANAAGAMGSTGGGGIGGASEGGFEVGGNFEEYDKNSDGKLTGKEIESWMSAADTNKDETITPEELKNWKPNESMANAFGGGGGRGGRGGRGGGRGGRGGRGGGGRGGRGGGGRGPSAGNQ